MGDKLDTWGKWKRDAIRDYGRASSEYLHNKSYFEKYANELQRAKIMSKLPWYQRWAIKGQALNSKINRHGMSILSEMGGSAAELAPDSWKGVAFDLGTLGIGAVAGTAGKLAKLGKLGRLGRLGGPMRSTTFKALQDIHKAAGFPKIASRAAKAQKAGIDGMDRIIRGAEAVTKATHAVHAGHLIEKSGSKFVNALLAHKTYIAPTTTTLIPRPTLPNIAGQIRVSLPQPQPLKPSKHQLPPLKRIQGLPKFKGGLVPGPGIGDFFKSEYMNKIKKYKPPLRQHKPGIPPPFKHVPGKLTSGIGSSSRPFNWKSNAIPPKALQTTYRPDQLGQAGWGQQVSLSRPANPLRNMWQQGNRFSPLTPQPIQKRFQVPPMRSLQSNPLRQMSQGLMNTNRARPMFR